MSYKFLEIAKDAIYAYELLSDNSQRVDSVLFKKENIVSGLENLVEDGIILNRELCFLSPGSANLQTSILSPLLDVSLPLGKFRHRKQIFSAAGKGFGKQGEKLLALSNNSSSNYGPMDYVAIDVYCAYWESKGALIGRKATDSIIWNHGCVTWDISKY